MQKYFLLSNYFFFQHIDKEILKIIRQTDKKQIIFYHDKSLRFELDKEFQQLWRNTSVDGLQDDNIDEYLTKQVNFYILLESYLIISQECSTHMMLLVRLLRFIIT